MTAPPIEFEVTGSLGEAAPDGIVVRFVTPLPADVDTLDAAIREAVVFLPPPVARAFWSRLGDVLREFDERAGAPSN